MVWFFFSFFLLVFVFGGCVVGVRPLPHLLPHPHPTVFPKIGFSHQTTPSPTRVAKFATNALSTPLSLPAFPVPLRCCCCRRSSSSLSAAVNLLSPSASPACVAKKLNHSHSHFAGSGGATTNLNLPPCRCRISISFQKLASY